MTSGTAVRNGLVLAALLVVGIVAGLGLRAAREPAAVPAQVRENPSPKPRPPRRHAEPIAAPAPPPVEPPPVPPAVAREVVGRVVLLPQRTPVAGAVVELWTGSSTSVSPCGRSVTTGDDGVFRFANCKTAYYRAEAHVAGLGSRNAGASVSLDAGANLGDLVFGDGGAVEGRVLGANGPVAKATVFACRGGAGGMPTSVSVGDDGNYRFADLMPGKYAMGVDLDPTHRRFGPLVTVEAGKTVRCDFAAAATLAGHVTLDGAAVLAGEVTVSRPNGQVAHSRIDGGTFRLEDLEPGETEVGVRVDGDAFTLSIQTLKVVSGENVLDIRLGEGERSSEIAGHATLPIGARPDVKFWMALALGDPVPGAKLPWTNCGSAELDESGGFRIRGLRAGRYRVWLAWGVTNARGGGLGGSAGSVEFDLGPGEHKAGVEVRPTLPDAGSLPYATPFVEGTCALPGRVSARATGKPLVFPDVQLGLYEIDAAGKTGRIVGTATAGKDGRFTFGSLQPGRRRLIATPNVGGLREAQIDVDVVADGGAKNAEVALDPMATGKVVFTVKDEQGRAVQTTTMFAELVGGGMTGGWGGASATGVFKRDYEAGTHVVWVSAVESGLSGKTTVDVREGGTAEIEVVLHPKK